MRLTHKYYAASAVRYLVQQTLIPRWREWLEGGQQLEVGMYWLVSLAADRYVSPYAFTGAWLYAQWFQPASHLDETVLDDRLARLVEEVKQKLAESNKRHPLLRARDIDHESKTFALTLLHPKGLECENFISDLRETIWPLPETREIIDALNYVFAVKNGFSGNGSDYYNVKNSFLNEVRIGHGLIRGWSTGMVLSCSQSISLLHFRFSNRNWASLLPYRSYITRWLDVSESTALLSIFPHISYWNFWIIRSKPFEALPLSAFAAFMFQTDRIAKVHVHRRVQFVSAIARRSTLGHSCPAYSEAR